MCRCLGWVFFIVFYHALLIDPVLAACMVSLKMWLACYTAVIFSVRDGLCGLSFRKADPASDSLRGVFSLALFAVRACCTMRLGLFIQVNVMHCFGVFVLLLESSLSRYYNFGLLHLISQSPYLAAFELFFSAFAIVRDGSGGVHEVFLSR